VTKKALCVGINTYRVKPLNGCVSDANDWATLLAEHYDFPKTSIKLLTDGDATKRGILDGLKGLLAGAQTGDVLVFTNSSHGAQVLDIGDGDEAVDEAICPVDFESGVLVDDELRELFTALGVGVHLAVIADSCHSGTVTRAPGEPTYSGEYTSRPRFLDWSFLPSTLRPTAKAFEAKTERYPEDGMREILLAGCTDRESSYDAPLDGRYHGVMTYHALSAIRGAGYRISYAQLAARLSELFARTKFAGLQHPQLEGRSDNKALQIFA